MTAHFLARLPGDHRAGDGIQSGDWSNVDLRGPREEHSQRLTADLDGDGIPTHERTLKSLAEAQEHLWSCPQTQLPNLTETNRLLVNCELAVLRQAAHSAIFELDV